MRRALLVLLLVAGCAGPRVPPDLRACPPPPAVPKPPPPAHTRKQLAAFAIRLELAREAERHRGDECAAKLRAVVRLAERGR